MSQQQTQQYYSEHVSKSDHWASLVKVHDTETIDLVKDFIVIGRHRRYSSCLFSCDIILDSVESSNRHCQIERVNDDLVWIVE